jgi:hypothetical protein
MKVVWFCWGVAVVALLVACAGKVNEPTGAGGGGGTAGASNKPVACPTAANADLSKLQGKACKTLYEGCGPGGCAYGCACIDLGDGLKWLCGVPPMCAK